MIRSQRSKRSRRLSKLAAERKSSRKSKSRDRHNNTNTYRNFAIDSDQHNRINRMMNESNAADAAAADVVVTSDTETIKQTTSVSIQMDRCAPQAFENCLAMMQEVMENSSLAFPTNSRDLEITCR